MSERERWIVYPLLFLALGAALRDKLSDQTTTKRIECQELIVSVEERAGQERTALVRIGEVPRSSAESPHIGEIQINGRLQAELIQSESINGGNYFYQGIQFAPTWLRAVPGVLRALKQSADAFGTGGDATSQPDQRAEPTQPPSDSPSTDPPATTPEPKDAPTSEPSGKSETPPAN